MEVGRDREMQRWRKGEGREGGTDGRSEPVSFPLDNKNF